MTRIRFGVIALLATFVVWGYLCGPTIAQRTTGPSPDELDDLAKDLGMGPAKCNAVQEQINQVVAVYQSSLSDEEKIAALSKLWSQSAVSLQKSASADPEVASTANQYLVMMQELMVLAEASPSKTDKNASPQAINSLKKLKMLTQNYAKMMKVMCPNLTLPSIMSE